MEVRVVRGDITQHTADAIVVNLFEGVTSPSGATGAVDQALGGAISQLISDGDIKGKLGETTVVHTFGKLPTRRVVVVGLGKAASFDLDRIRNLGGDLGRYLRRINAETAATIVHGAGIGGLEPEAAAQALTEGLLLGSYTYRKHITRGENKDVREVVLIEADDAKIAAEERGVERGRILADATNLVRDLANEPSNNLPPAGLAEAARKVAEQNGLEIVVLGPEQMRSLGMGGVLAVGQGSVNEPRFIVLRYKGGAEGEPPAVALVGKGVTFDSGGISIKPADGMGEMKGDMQGGACVIGVMQAIAQLKPPINVLGVVPAAENMPGGGSYRPGDIVKISNGKTIEIINTDAEGRMLLADGLSFARKEGAKLLVDIATLTGAASVAVGPFFTGVFSNNDAAAERVMAWAKASGEQFWRLPLTDDYKELIKSDVADMRQTGPRQGGASTAATVLWEFAEETPWVHLDIAPTSRSDKDKGYMTKGMTGVAVRTLINTVIDLARPE